MSYWRDIWKIIESDGTSTKRDAQGGRVIVDGYHFKGMTPRRQQRVIDTMANEMREMVLRASNTKSITTLSDIRKESSRLFSEMLAPTANGVSRISGRILDSFGNYAFSSGVQGQDPHLDSFMTPNVWIDPGEAAAVFSQGGMPTFIIKKKSKPVSMNGVTIKNPKLSREQMDTVNESAECKTGFARALSEGAENGLVYGGALAFPFFKKDIPLTLGMDVAMLAKVGVIEKGCIDRYVVLDRNNVVHIPNWNPTARDFQNPFYYFIPYLGADVCGQRCARIVPLRQPGYWGTIMTLGWGVSDIPGWYQAVCNYEQVTKTIPDMIKQMSILVRTFNVDLANAINGLGTIDQILEKNTLAVREASSLNPISMDLVGDLKAIQRDFKEVAALTRLVRQDLAMKANIPEEKFWSSEKAAFSSGDMSDSLNEGEWGGVKYVHDEVESRSKNLAMIEIINALGKDREILAALPYTTVEIGEPKIESASKRAEIYGLISEGTFKQTAAGVPVDVALEIAAQYGDKHLLPSAEIMGKLAKRQKESDERAIESHEMEIELQKQQLENAKAGLTTPGGGSSSASPPGKKEGYTPLEQKQHEKTRGLTARREGVGKLQGKKIGG